DRLGQRRKAREAVGEIEEWLKDKELRPSEGAYENLWPSLRILKPRDVSPTRGELNEQQLIYKRQQDRWRDLQNRTTKLFDLFAEYAVNQAYKKRTKDEKSATWAKFASKRALEGGVGYQEWYTAATMAWE